MTAHSRNKGARGERQWRDVLIRHGFEAIRGQQHSGSPDSPDVRCNTGIHWEVKRVERLDLTAAMRQAMSECGVRPPAVAHRRNGHPWMVTMIADHFLPILVKAVREKGEPT